MLFFFDSLVFLFVSGGCSFFCCVIFQRDSRFCELTRYSCGYFAGESRTLLSRELNLSPSARPGFQRT